MPVLEAGPATATVDPDDGCRVTSVTVDGIELIGRDEDAPGAGAGPFHHGCFPMAPFAGRLRHGRFRFAGEERQVPVHFEGHAIHGVVCDRPWSASDRRPDEWTCAFDERWPFPGHAVQRVDLDAHRLRLELEVHADDPARPMPATAGWHPWFRRHLDLPAGRAEADLTFRAGRRYRKDDEGIPDGSLVVPSAGPFDDCFTDLGAAPTITWPGFGSVEIASDASHLVVYTEPRTALCVEPQTGPPDAPNLGAAAIVRAGRPLRVWMELRWRRERSGTA